MYAIHMEDALLDRQPTKILISSTDSAFLVALIDWLNDYDRVVEGSTTIELCNGKETEKEKQ